ncbi:MAG TPA: hypothetical protein VMY99_02820 [Nevskiaceae bacterium]|nr:hypothetical protein [Nevskiaceae bacterium]
MQRTTSSGGIRPESERGYVYARISRLLETLKKKKMLLFLACIAIAALIFVIILVGTFLGNEKSHRSESYKKVSGAAGLHAVITYDAQRDTKMFNFNVYILKADGQQVGVVQPDKDGNVNMALPEGNYVMLIGKQFGKDKLFPEEPMVLKTGQELELKLHYKEGGL